MKAIVDIGVACAGTQTKEWWSVVMGMLLQEHDRGISFGAIRAVGSALPDFNKNNLLGDQKSRLNLTDMNRVEITRGFLNGSSDWLFQMDDDTVPPYDAISRLLMSGRDFIAGLYFLPKKPFNPIAYYRDNEGTYKPLYGYPKGSMVQVDSVGMGCTLIHRSVFERIIDAYTVYVRPNGSLLPILKTEIRDNEEYKGESQGFLKHGLYHIPVKKQGPDDKRNFPFYALEYGRTEDHYFCELAATVGIRPWVDTAITCQHIKYQPTTEADYDREVEAANEGA
jgi:hypothetical protein